MSKYRTSAAAAQPSATAAQLSATTLSPFAAVALAALPLRLPQGFELRLLLRHLLLHQQAHQLQKQLRISDSIGSGIKSRISSGMRALTGAATARHASPATTSAPKTSGLRDCGALRPGSASCQRTDRSQVGRGDENLECIFQVAFFIICNKKKLHIFLLLM